MTLDFIKKRSKSILSFLLIFVLALVFIGCNGEEDEDKKYTVEDLDTNITDEVKLLSSFENRRFILHGIEEVSLHRLIDGDTTHFMDGNRNVIKIRYLGINTPESTGQIEPWGRQASTFVKNKLENAVSIVIEAENVGSPAEVDATGDRYLGYVWYKPSANEDYRLLNLEIIENCFSYFTGNQTELKYGDYMHEAYLEKSVMKLRIFGEEDPNFDYDNTVLELSIHQLLNNFDNYSNGSKLKFEARIMRMVGNSLYVEDVEEAYDDTTGTSDRGGIFVYHSFAPGLGTLKPGQVIQFEAQASDGAFGTQLVNPSKVRMLEEYSEYTIREIDSSVTSLEEYEGLVVKINGFTVTSIGNENDVGAYTIYGLMENGAEMQVRIDADASPKLAYTFAKVGLKYNVIGGVSKYVNPYEGNREIYQIQLGNFRHDGINDFLPVKVDE